MIKEVGGVLILPRHRLLCHCGIYTHHRRRSNPHEYGYNVGCLEGVNPSIWSRSHSTTGCTTRPIANPEKASPGRATQGMALRMALRRSGWPSMRSSLG